MRPDLEGNFEVKGGSLRAAGLACSRHVLQFDAPSLRYSFSLQEPWSTKGGFFQVGLADDGYGNFVACSGLGALYVIDKPTGVGRSHAGAAVQLLLGNTYHIALENDGKTLTAKLDGRELRTVPIAPRVRGNLFLSCASESPFAISELVIEGVVDASSRASLCAHWVEEQMAQAGLPGLGGK